MFANTFYDRQSNKFHFWEFDANGKVKHTVEKYQHIYYEKDNTNSSEYSDIYGNKVVKKYQQECIVTGKQIGRAHV